MRQPGTLMAVLAVTPLVCVVSQGSSPTGPSLDISSIRAQLANARRERSSDPLPISVTTPNESGGLATLDDDKRLRSQWLKREGEKARLENEINSYSRLEKDWDDRGAMPPSKLSLRLARNLARWASDNGFTPARTYPSPNGEVGLVWEAGAGYGDLSIAADGTISYYIKDRTGAREIFSSHRIPIADLPGEFWSLASTL